MQKFFFFFKSLAEIEFLVNKHIWRYESILLLQLSDIGEIQFFRPCFKSVIGVGPYILVASVCAYSLVNTYVFY